MTMAQMVTERGSELVSCFSVEVGLINHSDELFQQLIPEHEVRSRQVRGLVDSGPTLPILSERLAAELGLPITDRVAEVTLADGSVVERRVVSDLRLSWSASDGEVRSGIFEAVVEPGREDLLIGAIVMEVLDLLVDCRRERLLPRKPGRPTYRA